MRLDCRGLFAAGIVEGNVGVEPSNKLLQDEGRKGVEVRRGEKSPDLIRRFLRAAKGL